MINGIIKLFYSDKVKSAMKKMPSDEYILDEKFTKLSNINDSMNKIVLFIFKISIISTILIISFELNLFLCVGLVMLMIINLIYIIFGEYDYESNVNMIIIRSILSELKNNIPSIIVIYMMVMILDFNIVSIVCLFIVFMFTIKNIYSNINK